MDKKTRSIRMTDEQWDSLQQTANVYGYSGRGDLLDALLKANAIEISAGLIATGKFVVAISEKLERVQAELKEQTYNAWLMEEFGWSREDADEIMRLSQEAKAGSNFIATSLAFLDLIDKDDLA